MPHLLSRVFINGNSQAVRIPQEFRLSASQVEIFRNADGDLVLHPVPSDRGAALLKVLNGFKGDFASALERQQQEQPGTQERPAL